MAIVFELLVYRCDAFFTFDSSIYSRVFLGHTKVYLVLPIINSLSEYLPSKAADTAKSLVLVDAIKQVLKKLEKTINFEGLLAKVYRQWQHPMGLSVIREDRNNDDCLHVGL